MADKSVKLLFEVARGGAAGDSAAVIKQQLGEIMQEVNNSNITQVKVRFNPASLRSLKSQLKNELSNISFTPSARSIQEMRKAIQDRLQNLPVNVKLNQLSTQQRSGGAGGGSSNSTQSANSQLAAESQHLNRLISEYTTLKRQADVGTFNNKADFAKVQELQKQVASLRSQIDQVINDMQQKGVQAWTNVANAAESKLRDIDVKIARQTSVAQAKWVADFQAQNQNAAQQFGMLEPNQLQYTNAQGQVVDLTKAYQDLQAAIDAVNRDISNPQNIANYNAAYENFNRTLQDITKNGPAAKSAIDGLATDIQAALNNRSSFTSDQLNRMAQILSRLQGTTQPTRKELESFSREFEKIKGSSAGAGTSVETFGTKLKKTLLVASGFGSLTMAISKAIQMMRKMVSAVVDLDTALTQMQIVTKGSDKQMDVFANSMARTAKQIGSSITDLIDSATVYARLGYSEMESSVLAKFTSMLQNTGDIDVSAAQDAVTAIVKAFNVNVDDIESVMDKMVEVGKHYCPAA